MNRIRTMKIILVCLAVLIIGTVILLVNKLRAEQAIVEDAVKEPAIVTATPVDTNVGEGHDPSAENTPTTVPTTAPTVTPEATTTPAPVMEGDFTVVDEHIFISADKVNLRAEASSTSEVIAEVSKSTLLKRTGISSEWSRVNYNSQTCYVSNEFVTDRIPEVATSGIDDPDSASVTSVGGKSVVIDPGHQGKGDSAQEPIGPGASSTKARVTSGTSGSVSGWDEYELNLAVSLQLRDELVRRGYTVYMTRETHDVSISNKERAEFATGTGADILVRIHANGSEDSSVNGALCMAPTNSNQFLSANLISESQILSRCIIDSYIVATGFGNQGVYPTDEMSGINWSTIPVTIVEMGYMSNPSDDAKMADSSEQVKMVKGIADGIDSYFTGGV